MRLRELLEGEGGPDSLGFARQLNAPTLLPVSLPLLDTLAPTPTPTPTLPLTQARLLLLDATALDTPDAVRSLLVSPKGWLCTLDHKSCQAAC